MCDLKKYEVCVSVTMDASVYVYAPDMDTAIDFVDNNIETTDYCNETCGFDFYGNDEDESCRFDEIANTTACNIIDITDVSECK